MFNPNMDLMQHRDFMHQAPQLQCKVTLQNEDLWQQFHELDTEMIITKSGRRMFPTLRVLLENLDPHAQYCVFVEMVPISKCRFKYSSSGGWAPAGAEEAQSPNRIYLHPISPATGAQWMSQVITFGRLKLTNTANPPPGHLVLSSMHKYEPKIIIAQTMNPRTIVWAPHMSTSFPATQFIAVTAYQNDRITKLKIDNNPFAKGFRENGQSKCKRKRQLPETETETSAQEQKKLKDLPEPPTSPLLNITDSDSDRTSSPETHLQPAPMYNPYRYPMPLHMDFYSQYQHYNPYHLYSSTPITYPPMNPFYNPYTQAPSPAVAQDLSLNKDEKVKKLTDFSIRAITGQT